MPHETIYTTVSIDRLIDVYIEHCIIKNPLWHDYWLDIKKGEVILSMSFLKDD